VPEACWNWLAKPFRNADSSPLVPSAAAYLVLGRLDLAAGRADEAGRDASEAQRLEPQSRAAQDLRHQIEAKQGQKQ